MAWCLRVRAPQRAGARVATAIAIAALFPALPVQAQVDPPPPPGTDFVSVVPSQECAASGFFSALAGHGYRDLWTTAIRVPVADLGTLGGGGLTPVRLGGGVTTQTLHMQGADGRRYVFRSVEKNSRQALAEEFWDTPVESIVQDQLCSFHPTGAVVAARLDDAVGVLHVEPAFYVIPDDPRLEEFREQFAGMLVLFEERADELPDNAPGFAGSDRIVQIENLFDALEEDPGEHVEVTELLESRLVDVLIGDRDRSINNHLWARFDEPDGGHLWRPIPRDRDQAFVRFDGALKVIARLYERRLVAFDDHYPSIEALTRSAWDIDRTLLVRLGRDQWDATVREVQVTITDDVIADAVRRIPPEHYERIGEFIETSLRARRDALDEAAEKMYQIVFRYADVRATDVDEIALLQGLDGGRMRLALFRAESGPEPQGEPYFERTFSPDETRELRIYMHGGDDVVRVEGNTDSPILVRVIGGGGGDQLVNDAGRDRVIFYDGGGATEVTGSGTKLVRRDVPRIYAWWVDGEGDLDWGSESFPSPKMGYDKDRGVVLGLGVLHDRYGFLRQPFSARIQASVGWSTARSQPIIDYHHFLQDRVFGLDLAFNARYSGIEIVRFYGLGNETTEDEDLSRHEVHQKQLQIGMDLSFGDGERSRFSIGPTFRYTSSDTSDATSFIAQTRPYGIGQFSQAGLQFGFDIDATDLRAFPRNGYRLGGGADYYPVMLDVDSTYGSVHGEASLYASLPVGNPTLALRAGGRKVFGHFPYSDAAYLGGSANLRGLREQRYAGDAVLYGSAELRVFLTRMFVILPLDIGVFGLTDVGRVFLDGESSSKWYDAFGGGIWLAPFNRSGTVHLSIARHGETTSFYFGTGFAF